eukprot:symbB.v1.2.024883.t1/scaffold2386.1/size80448/1
MDLKAKAEGAESHVEIKEAEHRRLMAGYQQRHAAREAKREKVQAERREKKKEAREEAKRKYVEMKRELEQAAAAADQEQAANEAQHGDEAVAKQMTKEEKARLQKLEQAVAAFNEKSTTIQKKIEKLTTQAEEAKDLKEKTQERVAKAKKMLEQRKKEAEQAKQEVAKAEEKKKVVVSKAQELTKKKKTFKTQAVERKAPVPPDPGDAEGMLAKLEAEVEKVRGPCEEVCAQEQKLLAKEQKLKLQIETRSEEVKDVVLLSSFLERQEMVTSKLERQEQMLRKLIEELPHMLQLDVNHIAVAHMGSSGSTGVAPLPPLKEDFDVNTPNLKEDFDVNAHSEEVGTWMRATSNDSRQSQLPQSYTMEELQLRDTAMTATGSIQRKRYSNRSNNEANEGKKKSRLLYMVTHPSFEGIFAGIVLLNAIFIGVDTESTLHHQGARPIELQVFNIMFACLFLLELILRIYASGRWFLCDDNWAWNWLDSLIVADPRFLPHFTRFVGAE